MRRILVAIAAAVLFTAIVAFLWRGHWGGHERTRDPTRSALALETERQSRAEASADSSSSDRLPESTETGSVSERGLQDPTIPKGADGLPDPRFFGPWDAPIWLEQTPSNYEVIKRVVDHSRHFDDFEDTHPITSRSEAIRQVTKVSMVSPFTYAFEDELRYYFSGGRRLAIIDDFSVGVAIRKSDGRRIFWSEADLDRK